MKHRVLYLAALPLTLALASMAQAGFRCGGCSDPCRTRYHQASACGGGCGATLVQPSPNSCGYVRADGAYMGTAYVQSGYAVGGCGAASGCGGTVAYAPAVMAGPAVMAAPAVMSAPAVMAGPAVGACQAPQLVCEPVTGYRTVMESTFVSETQYVDATETRQEVRQRVRQVSKSVPVTYEDYRIKTVNVPRTETKTIEYSVLVPEQSTRTVPVNVTVPVWSEVSENYTVKVPKITEVQETYQVKVPRLRDETFSYTVYVPQTESVTKMQTVTNAVPVVKTRTVQRTIPKYSTQTVTKDYGHWDTVVEEVAGSCYSVASAPSVVVTGGGSDGYGYGTVSSAIVGGGCGSSMFASGCSSGCGSRARVRCGRVAVSSCSTGCGGCGSVSSGCGSCSGGCGADTVVSSGYAVSGGTVVGGGCGQVVATAPATTTRRVWVPNVVTEEVQVVTNDVVNEEVAYTVYEQQSTQVPIECTYVVYRPEARTGTKKVVDYVPEDRTRIRKVVSYVDEQRTRTRRVVSYKNETREESYPYVTYRTEKRTKEISYTVNEVQQVVEPFQATRMETVVEEVVEDYTVNVQVPVTREVQVQVCKMVPKLVPYTFNPCAGGVGSGAMTVGYGSALNGVVSGGCGCGGAAPAVSSGCGCGAAAPVAPVSSGCGCGQ